MAGVKYKIAVKVMILTNGSMRSIGRAALESIIQYPASITETIIKTIPETLFKQQTLFSFDLCSFDLKKYI